MTQKLQDLADLVEIQIQLPASNVGSQLGAIPGLGNLVLSWSLERTRHICGRHTYIQANT